MRRIAVVGSSGSGKTTTARAISSGLGIPHVELDSVFHQAGWTPLPTDEFQSAVREFTDQGTRRPLQGSKMVRPRAGEIARPS